jgi:predicted transcriptional regulator
MSILLESRRPTTVAVLGERLGRYGKRRKVVYEALHRLEKRGLVELWMDTGAPRLVSY